MATLRSLSLSLFSLRADHPHTNTPKEKQRASEEGRKSQVCPEGGEGAWIKEVRVPASLIHQDDRERGREMGGGVGG